MKAKQNTFKTAVKYSCWFLNVFPKKDYRGFGIELHFHFSQSQDRNNGTKYKTSCPNLLLSFQVSIFNLNYVVLIFVKLTAFWKFKQRKSLQNAFLEGSTIVIVMFKYITI